MIHIDTNVTPKSLAARRRPSVRTFGAEDRADRQDVGLLCRHAGVHRRGPLHVARLDRVDAGVPVRFGNPAVRRDGRPEDAGDRTARHGAPHGEPRQPHRRARSRVQQRLHLRQPAAPRAGRPHRRRRVGGRLLRACAEALRRGPGGALDRAARRPRLHPLVQRAAFAVRRHDALAALARGRAPARPRADGRARPQDFAAAAPRPARRHQRALQRLLRRGARRLRRARPRRARVDLQRQRRLVPLPQHAAGLFAVHHLDARPRVGADRLRRSSSSSSTR